MTNLSAQTIQHQVRGMPAEKKKNFLITKAEIAQGYTATTNGRHLQWLIHTLNFQLVKKRFF